MSNEVMRPIMDDFSRLMVESIPKKVINWLMLLGEDLTEVYQYADLEVSIEPEGGYIQVADFRLEWTGTIDKPTSIWVNHLELLDIRRPGCLDVFIEVEELVYSPLVCRQKEIDDIEAPRIHIDGVQANQE